MCDDGWTNKKTCGWTRRRPDALEDGRQDGRTDKKTGETGEMTGEKTVGRESRWARNAGLAREKKEDWQTEVRTGVKTDERMGWMDEKKNRATCRTRTNIRED